MALRQLLAVRAVEQRQVRVGRRLGAERLQDQDLARRVREVVLAADDVRDAHVAVVHRDREVVERAAVRAGDHEVVDRRQRERDVAADHVLHDDLALVRDLDADGALVLVAVPAREDLVDRGAVLGRALELAVRPLVPVEPEPGEGVEDLLDVLGRRALAVGVLDAQDELAAAPAREQPVVEGGAGAPDVEGTGRRRCEADAHARAMLDRCSEPLGQPQVEQPVAVADALVLDLDAVRPGLSLEAVPARRVRDRLQRLGDGGRAHRPRP